jgi:hypothetical protein
MQFANFIGDYCDWLWRREPVAKEYAEALPCLGSCDAATLCRNCRLAVAAVEAIVGPPPHRGDYREDP